MQDGLQPECLHTYMCGVMLALGMLLRRQPSTIAHELSISRILQTGLPRFIHISRFLFLYLTAVIVFNWSESIRRASDI